MRMFERLGIAKSGFLKDSEERAVAEVYERYKSWYTEYSGNGAKSPLQFLFMDLDHESLDVFIWRKGMLVKTRDGKIGITTGWTQIGNVNPDYRVTVKTSNGEMHFKYEDLQPADIPPEVVDYAKGDVLGIVEKLDENIRKRIHEKVDEAFGIK